MTEKYRYEFDQKNGILYKHHFGNISVEDILLSWLYAFENEIIPKETAGIILDYMNADMNFGLGEVSKITNFFQEHINVFRNLKIAIVTNNPKDTVKPAIVQEMNKDYILRPFSSIEAAREWILS